MCLGIPGQVIALHEDRAAVDLRGVARDVDVTLLSPPPRPGDWVLVHAGYALEVLPATEAARLLALAGDHGQGVDDDPGRVPVGPKGKRGADGVSTAP